jgi:phospholipase/carboxylesterase
VSPEYLPCVEIEPRVPARSAVVWLHGLGADGHDFEPIAPLLGLDDDLGVRFVFPHAPRRAVTVNMGLIMPAWYDILSLDLRRDHDDKGIRESAEHVRALIARENERGVPTDRIVLAGFSQGGAIALHVALRHEQAFAGIMALSCYLVREEALERERTDANRDTGIFQAHGVADPMVPVERGEATHRRLVEWGYDVEWHTYKTGHQVHPDEILDIGNWLRARLASAS